MDSFELCNKSTIIVDKFNKSAEILLEWLSNFTFERGSESAEYHDVKLVGSDGELFSHSVVLQAISPVLHEILNSQVRYS